jgi:hypothetical protein
MTDNQLSSSLFSTPLENGLFYFASQELVFFWAAF